MPARILTQTPEQIARRLVRELWSSLRAAGRSYLRYGETIGDLRLTVAARYVAETACDAADLPAELRCSRPSTRQVYRVLRDIRRERGEAAAVMPADIEQWLRDRQPDEPSRDTINHALRALRDREVAWSSPGGGWRIGREQPRLPISSRQSDGPSGVSCAAYTEVLAGAGVRRFTEAPSMLRQRIWVPGEKSEYGVVITDAITEACIAVAERIGEMRVPTRSGRLCKMPAARGELVGVEGRYAVVKFPGGHRINVRVLGDWHLAGLTSPTEDSGTAGGVVA
jgi:hypothetical protein